MRVIALIITLFIAIPCNAGSSRYFDYTLSAYVNQTSNLPDTFTLCAWFNADNFPSAYQTILSDASASYMLIMFKKAAGGNKGDFSTWSSDGLADNNFGLTGVLDDEWHQICFVREGDSVTNGYKAYYDGAFQGQANTGTWSPGQAYHWGRRTGQTQYWFGWMANVRVWSVALDATEIAQAYRCMNQPVRGLHQSLLLFENGTSPTFQDISGNGNNGTNQSTTQDDDFGPPNIRWCSN